MSTSDSNWHLILSNLVMKSMNWALWFLWITGFILTLVSSYKRILRHPRKNSKWMRMNFVIGITDAHYWDKELKMKSKHLTSRWWRWNDVNRESYQCHQEISEKNQSGNSERRDMLKPCLVVSIVQGGASHWLSKSRRRLLYNISQIEYHKLRSLAFIESNPSW